ncbi:MAG: DNA repair protein RadA [Clostridiales bacterium]|nr:DNA repair protein RadA [Clostridiales bacterium]
MSKEKTIFFCASCGGESIRWQGRCPHCGEWNTLVEERVVKDSAGKAKSQRPLKQAAPLMSLDSTPNTRWQLGLSELDNVLGGGLVPGSSLLLAGEPGIGKSTLLLQLAHSLAYAGQTLYVSGEESPQQILSRARRLRTLDESIMLLAENEIGRALAEAERLCPALLIIDSVQALYDSSLSGAGGSVSQVRSVAAACLAAARELGCAVVLVGHVTKDGQIAGPRLLEHMVDTVLYFEGDRHQALRLLRAVKNRFGATNEVGVFEMTGAGLLPLDQPSAYFLSGRETIRPGSAATCVMQGNRPMLLEVQALVVPSGFGNARRLAAGYETQRLLMLLAVLERRFGLPLGTRDVYVNIAGGLRVEDTAIDLAVAAAVVSSLKERPLEEGMLIFGELGLLGELRSVGQTARRLREGAAFGFGAALIPRQGALRRGEEKPDKKNAPRVLEATDLAQSLSILGLDK